MFLILLVGLITLSIIFIRHIYTYWQRKGFPYSNPNIPFGCLNSLRKGQRSFGMSIYDVYKSASSEKFIGIYLMFRPALLIRDAELARDVLVNNFNSFHDRGVYVDEVNDPFSANLFTLPGQKWKVLRGKLAPFFTPVKLRAMFPTIENVALRMIEHLDGIVCKNIDKEQKFVVELKSLFSRYVIDIIASVVFGLDIDSFKDPNNEFLKISESIRYPSTINSIRNATQMLCPQFEKVFFHLGFKQDYAEFMTDIVRQTVEYRENNNIIRRDIMQMLIQLRNTGEVNADENFWKIDTSKRDNSKSMSIESIASTAFLFYIAGYETSATTAAYIILELAKNPDILEKVQIDIGNNLEGGKLTYEGIQNMKYLDLCFTETVRKYPVLPLLNRQCTQDYPIPDTDKVIEKGTPIIISLLGMHRDAKYYPDPLKFDPERFRESNQTYDTKAYMPFGEGPRHCIAQQMGKINVKVAVIHILRNYNLEAVEEGEIQFDALTVTLMPKGGINVKLSKKII